MSDGYAAARQAAQRDRDRFWVDTEARADGLAEWWTRWLREQYPEAARAGVRFVLDTPR